MKYIAYFILLFSGISGFNISDLGTFNLRDVVEEYESGLNQSECEASLSQFFRSLISGEEWALQMADASGKLASGILVGNVYSLGNWGECLDVKNETLKGQYCTARISLKNNSTGSGLLSSITYRLGICVPDSCNGSEIEAFGSTVLDRLGLNSVNLGVNDKNCYTTGLTPWTAGGFCTLALICFVVLLAILSTFYDIFFDFYSKKDCHSKSQLFAAFSFYTNSRKLISVNKNPGPLASLNGIRVLSIGWVMLGHRYIMLLMSPIENMKDTFNWMQKYSSSLIVNGTYSVDTFLVMSGVLLAYVFFTKYEKDKKFNIVMFYVHRILRLTPVLIIMVLITMFLSPHLGSGPSWDMILRSAENCRKSWWKTLLYINNYQIENYEICMEQTWYLSVDMQLYIFSPILLLPLIWKPKLGQIWAVFSTLVFFVLCIVLSTVNNWKTSFINFGNITYYMSTHTRVTPYLMGFVTGFFLAKNRKNIRFKKIFVITGWIAALAIMGAVVIGGHNLTIGNQNTELENVTFLSLSRPGWAVAILWIIVANFYGYGGPINWFLSLDIFQILARLTYSIYLIHFQFQMITSASQKTTVNFSNQNMVHTIAGDIGCVLVISYFFCLLFESPIINLERHLLREGRTSPKANGPA